MGVMTLHTPSLLIAKVVHERTQPKRHKFSYNVYYLCFATHAVQSLKRFFLPLSRFSLMSYWEKDRGDRVQNNDRWIRSVLKDWHLSDIVTGNIILVTMPRILGYAFNPVSFWFCFDEQEHLRAVLSEVCNTFGERHCYISYHDDKRPITQDDWLHSEKVFHVSPFMQVEGRYDYRFICTKDKVAVWINYMTAQGTMLHTSIIGKRIPLTNKNLLIQFIVHPFVTFKVTSLIYMHALKLVSKGITYTRKPTPPFKDITR
jgi:uncharacterized protein